MTEYNKLVHNEIDFIDAAVFSGDLFLNKENRKDFREWIARWEKQLADYDDIPELDDEILNSDDDWFFNPNDGA